MVFNQQQTISDHQTKINPLVDFMTNDSMAEGTNMVKVVTFFFRRNDGSVVNHRFATFSRSFLLKSAKDN